jgi:hypothetical protein
MKEIVNFLFNSKCASTRSGERKGKSDVGRTIKGEGYHWIRYAWYSEFKIMIPATRVLLNAGQYTGRWVRASLEKFK